MRGFEVQEAVSTPISQFQATLSGCGVSLRARAFLEIRGSDRVRWLNGMVTNNVRDLAPGQGVYAFVLSAQGRIQGDLYAFNRGETMLIETEPAQVEKLAGIFDRYIIMDDVEVSDLTSQIAVLTVLGPHAERTLRVAGFEVANFSPPQLVDLTWQGESITIVRVDNPMLENYEVWIKPSAAKKAEQALTNAGATIINSETLEVLRIASGHPRYEQDILEKDLPQETSQTRALNFNKGCYLGQEIVERIRSRGNVHRQFSGFLVEGTLPETGSKIFLSGKEVGEIRSTAMLPWATGGQAVALGYLRREAALPGNPLVAGEAKLTLARLPFQESRAEA